MGYLESIHAGRIYAPFFGPNSFVAIVQPAEGGNIPTDQMIEMKLTFKEGGVVEFYEAFQSLREKRLQNIEIARLNGSATGGTHTLVVESEQLPAYDTVLHIPNVAERSNSDARVQPAIVRSMESNSNEVIPTLPPPYRE